MVPATPYSSREVVIDGARTRLGRPRPVDVAPSPLGPRAVDHGRPVVAARDANLGKEGTDPRGLQQRDWPASAP
jgi:hypothetical protein